MTYSLQVEPAAQPQDKDTKTQQFKSPYFELLLIHFSQHHSKT